jgi:hypothetical protein
LKLAVLKKWTPRQVKSPYNTWSLAVRCPVSSHRRQSQQSGMELGLHFRRGFERRIVFVVGAHESRRDVRRLDHARPPQYLSAVQSLAAANLPDSLAELRRVRLNSAFRERVRLVRRAPINSPQRVQHRNGQGSCPKSSEYFTACCVITGPFAEIAKKLEIVGISDNSSNFVAPFP